MGELAGPAGARAARTPTLHTDRGCTRDVVSDTPTSTADCSKGTSGNLNPEGQRPGQRDTEAILHLSPELR